MSKSGLDLTDEDFIDTMIQSIALSTLLIERFDKMIEEKYAVQTLKQSVKTTLNHLNSYIDNLFKGKSDDKDTIFGADVVFAIQNKIEVALKDKHINIVSDRDKILRSILASKNVSDEVIEDIMMRIEEIGVLKI